jgi:hypothetical protein
MKKPFLLAMVFCCFCVEASAEGRLGLGLRAGPSFYTQDVFGGTSDGSGALKVGPIVSGNLIYRINDSFSVGINAEWETHEIQSMGSDIGDARAVSVIPFAEYRYLGKQILGQGEDSFYVFLGLGYNINSYDPKDQVKETAKSLGASYGVKVDDTFALKVGGGFETFFTDRLAFNMEFGWKLNKGDAREFVDGTEVLSGDFNGSALSVLIGLRYYFPL